MDRLDLQNDWAFRSRLVVAYVTGVDTTGQRMTCRVVGSHESHDVDLPVEALNVQGLASSWQRHVPNRGTFVQLAFDTRNHVRFVRTCTWNGAGNGSGGLAAVPELVTAPITDGGPGFGMSAEDFGAIWRKLAPGEFDLRSSSGAGYYFTADGRAIVEAGPTVLTLNKTYKSATFDAAQFGVEGEPALPGKPPFVLPGSPSTFFRFGDVTRSLGGMGPKPVFSLLTNPLATQEFSWSIAALPPTGVPLMLADATHGDVRDPSGFVPVPMISTVLPTIPAGTPLRGNMRWWDWAGQVPMCTVQVDVLGNALVTSLAAVGVQAIAVDVRAATTIALGSGGGPGIHNAAYGEMMQTAYDAHVHPTAFGPSGQPVPLMTAAAFSPTFRVT